MPYQALKLEGLQALQQALNRIDVRIRQRLQGRLAELAEPVRERAQELAGSEIRNIGDEWSEMKVGVGIREVYVAPARRRGRGSPRRNLAGLLMSRALRPAGEQERATVEAGLQQLLDEIVTEENVTAI